MNTIQNLCFIEKYDDILLDILRWKVYAKIVSSNLHVAKPVRGMVNNILKFGLLHIAAESRSRSAGLICGCGFDSAESFNPELTTEGLAAGCSSLVLKSIKRSVINIQSSMLDVRCSILNLITVPAMRGFKWGISNSPSWHPKPDTWNLLFINKWSDKLHHRVIASSPKAPWLPPAGFYQLQVCYIC